MGRQFSWIFLGVSAAFFLFITGLTGYRIDTVRRANGESARVSAVAIAARARSLAAGTGGFAGTRFKDGMKESFEADSRLLLAAVRSDRGGFLWLMARDLRALEDPAEPTEGWRGTPVYRVNRGSERLVTQPLSSGPEGSDIVFDGVFLVLGREDLYPVLRDDLYLFLAFLLASGIFMLLTLGYPEVRTTAGAPGAAPTAETRTAAAPGPFASRIPADALGPHARSLASPSTGLVWAEHLAPRLKAEIERAAAADQDLSFARIVLDQPPDAPGSDAAAAEVARQLRSSFPVADLLFESGPGSFSVLLPDQDLDQAVRTLDGLRSRVAASAPGGARCTVSVGVSARGGRLIEENTLLVEAEIASGRAVREGGDRVVGFRADPAKFRAALGGV
jgi:GGDEF domain-containing protein